MDREEKLRAAKEKLKKFQKKKNEQNSEESSTTRSTPKLEVDSQTPLPLFTFDSSKATEVSDFLGLQAETIPQEPRDNTTTPTTTSVTDQIEQVLANSNLNAIDDGDDDVAEVNGDHNELEYLRVRLSQLETERSELMQNATQQKKQIQSLQSDFNSAEAQVASLQGQLDTERAETRAKEAEEAERNKSTLHSHMDTIQILIADKAELEANVKKFREDIANLTEENSLLKNNRNGSNAHRERTCACTDRVFLAEVERKSLSDKLSNLRDERDKLKIDCIDLKQEVLELKSKVDVSDKKSIFLAQQLQETVTKLELAEVNLSQLRAAAAAVEDGTGADENANNEETGKKEEEESKAMLEEKEGEIQRLVKENEGYVQRVADLTAYIQQASHDREQIIQQYTTYSQQLTVQIEELTKQLNDKATENHSYATREADLVGHVQRLEAQLQTSPPRKSPERNLDPDREKELKILRTNISELDQKVLALQLERDELQERHRQDVLQLQASHGKCTALEETVGQLNTQLEMSKDSTSMQNLTHHEDLVAASTSDKVAASRAMKQNQILKKQIEEIEFSLIQSANDKAKIMNELDAAQSKAKKSADLEHDLKQQLQGMNEAVKERDRNLAAMKEQIKYYVAFAEHSISNPKPTSVSGNADNESQENSSLEHVNNLVKDLQEAKAEIQSLSSVNLELKSQLDSMASSTSSSSSEDISATEVIQVTTSNGGGEEKDEKNEEISESSSGSTNGSPQIKLPKEVALMKVEQKFSQAMHQIAELSAEKEQLEHLVVRLQDETDTVGEYITIYQHQRAKQKEQLQEKERQLQAVARDREELKGKLCQLQGLLTEYMANGNGSNDNAGVCEVAQEAVPTDDDQKTEEGLTSSDNISPAGQIMNLLTEIGSNDMLQSKYDAKFQPWFWEPSSGRLIHI